MALKRRRFGFPGMVHRSVAASSVRGISVATEMWVTGKSFE
jgi:hypothetical protein